MIPETFSTARLTMRAMRIEDAEAAHVIFADEALMTYWTHAAHDTLEQTVAALEERIAAPGWAFWAITLADDDHLVGTLAASEKRQGGVFEIGYSLARAESGKGYAREAVAGLIDRLFAQGARRVFADTDPDNAPSNRLLEALGFTLEGRLRGEWETHIGVRDSFIWGRLATDPAPAAR